MSAYGFNESLSKVNTATQEDLTALAGRVAAIETYDSGSSGNTSSEATTYVSYSNKGTLVKRGDLVSMAWTFNTRANVPAYTSIATLPTKFRPMQRHYFVDSTGLRFMVTVTGYIQNVDALPSGKEHILGTSYMGKD